MSQFRLFALSFLSHTHMLYSPVNVTENNMNPAYLMLPLGSSTEDCYLPSGPHMVTKLSTSVMILNMMAEIAKVFVKLVIKRKKENVSRDPNKAGVVVVL